MDIKDILDLLNKARKYEDWDYIEEATEYLEEFIDDKDDLRME
jgi:hypothetical protein